MSSLYLYDRPGLFYFLSICTSWISWFIAAYLSHLEAYQRVSGILMLIGLVSPTVVAFTMIYVNDNLKKDLSERLFTFTALKPFYVLLAFSIMPFSILLAQGISLLFGYSAEQFLLSSHASFSFSLFPAWMMLLVAPTIEELAWHSYGTDCLRTRFSLFTTCIIFALFWVGWHFPLSFIKGYYHSNIAESSWIYSLNFAISLFPFVFLMNWLYYKADRSIIVAIIFHVTAGFFNELFATHPDSKIIQTVLLSILTLVIIYKQKHLFFNGQAQK